MTPRPQVFAVPQSITIERFLELLKEHNFSRVPVYERTLDSVTGIAFAHDLLQITDEEAQIKTVASIQHPAVFVPETKRGYELLREMQREKQHMRIVIDEYGGVSGLVTIEDLLEEIVGDIRDEHEKDAHIGDPLREPGGVWVVPGDYPVDELPKLVRRRGRGERKVRSHHSRRPGERNRGADSAAGRSRAIGRQRPSHSGGCLDRSPRRQAAHLSACEGRSDRAVLRTGTKDKGIGIGSDLI